MKQEHMTITLKNPGQQAPAVQAAETLSSAPIKKPRRFRLKFLKFFIGLIVLALVAFGCYELYKVFSAEPASSPASTSAAAGTGDESEQMVAKVSKLMLLPNETPTVAVVSDLGKLQGQKFFANAKQGDVVLMYAQAQKAILYSPSVNKIIEVAPIVNNQPESQQ